MFFGVSLFTSRINWYQTAAAKGKKLINSVDRCVDDNLEGYVALNPGVRLLKDHRIVIRADFQVLEKKDKVAVVCGGGSGHEPAFAGYVGEGMLTAAVMGSVFASPPSSEVLVALRAVGKNNSAGCLLLIPNYTGDRLNFGLAAERAQSEGIQITTRIIGEDTALTTSDKSAGRRGLTGIIIAIKRKKENVVIEKKDVSEKQLPLYYMHAYSKQDFMFSMHREKIEIAGDLAEKGYKLEEIVKILDETLSNMGTIGLALSPCIVPGSGPTFHLEDDEMELGLGIHGEAGVKRLKITPAKEAVKIMLDHLTNPSNENHLPLKNGDLVALFINDLGGISHMELNIVSKESINYLESLEVHVIRAYCSPFITSLEMAGVHITILLLNDTILRCIDAPTQSPAWPRLAPHLTQGMMERSCPSPLVWDYAEVASTADQEVTFEPGTAGCLYNMVIAACEELISAEFKLNNLDAEAGDGDCGSTLARGSRAILRELQSDKQELLKHSPVLLARQLAVIAESTMGGASGGLYGLFFTGVATSFQDHAEDIWTNALRNGIKLMKRYGGAEVGDRTMLDALCPALEALSSCEKDPPKQRFMKAVLAAEEGAEKTIHYKARAGRSSYVSPSLLQHPDPGAVGVTVWLKAAFNKFQ